MMKRAVKFIAWTIVVYGLGFLALRGAMSFWMPMGMECGGSKYADQERACVFGPGIVGKQECRGGKWAECEQVQCKVGR